MIRTVMAEAGSNGSPEEKAAVAHVILNRIGDPQYGNSVRGVLFQRNAFEPWGAGIRTNNPLRFDAKSSDYSDTGKIVDDVISGKNKDATNGADRFQQPETVNKRYKAGQVSQSALAPRDAQRIGSQVFWSTRKGDQDLVSKFYKDAPEPQPTQTTSAGNDTPVTQGPQSSADDDALLGKFYNKPEQPAKGATEAPDPTYAEIPQSTVPDAIPMPGETVPVTPRMGAAYQLAQQHPIATAAAGASIPLAISPAGPAAVSSLANLVGKILPFTVPYEMYRGGQDILDIIKSIRGAF